MDGSPQKIEISGEQLTLESVAAVARERVRVELSQEPEVGQRIVASRKLLEEKLEGGEIIYGVTTGYGGNVRFLIPQKELAHHQENIFQYMICGTGAPLPEDAVRAAILLRANSLAKGYSGVRLVVIERLLDLLNKGITPVVPRYGSVGASGDLIPSSYIGRVLLAQGEVSFQGQKMPARDALRQAELEPIGLEAKEGLALINGTTVMTGIGSLVIHDGAYLSLLALACASVALEALQGTDDPFREIIHRVKQHPGQMRAAAICRRLLEGSQYVRNLDEIRERVGQRRDQAEEGIARTDEAIQNPYSLRCVPQGLGPMMDALQEHRTTFEREINSVNDNPLLDPSEGRVYHTGNFYGGHIARALDSWKIDLATVGNWLHALMALVVDDKFSNGLPANLVPNPGLFTGFKAVQLSLTSLVCTLRHLANPSMIHSLPTEQYNQDIVSLGAHAALTAMDMTRILQDATALLLITLLQAIDLRSGGASLGQGNREIYEVVRSQVSFLDQDRILEGDIARVAELIRKRLIKVPQDP